MRKGLENMKWVNARPAQQDYTDQNFCSKKIYFSRVVCFSYQCCKVRSNRGKNKLLGRMIVRDILKDSLCHTNMDDNSCI